MNRYFVIILLSFISLNQKALSAVGDVKELTEKEGISFPLSNIDNFTGTVIFPDKFINSNDKKSISAKEIPENVLKHFDNDVSLIIHSAFIKLPFSYESYIKSALENKASIERSILYNTKIQVNGEELGQCSTLNGRASIDINLPSVMKVIDFPEKLLCDIKIVKQEEGRNNLKKEFLSKLPPTIKDEEIHSVTFNYSNCNMIFRELNQTVHFTKTSDGKTLLIFENYSLVKNMTIDKLSKIRLIIGPAINFINDQVIKNTKGLLKYIQLSNK